MTVVFPDGVLAQGNGGLWFVPSIANVLLPKVTEVAAGFVLSCAISGFSPSGDQGTSTDPRYCSTQQFEIPGRNQVSIDPLEYVYDPQNPDDVDTYEYYVELTEGRKGFAVNRLGLPYDQVLAVGDFVNIYPVIVGAKNDVPIDPTAEGSKIKIRQKLFVSGPVQRDVALVAGP